MAFRYNLNFLTMFLASVKKQVILLESCCQFDKKATQRVTQKW